MAPNNSRRNCLNHDDIWCAQKSHWKILHTRHTHSNERPVHHILCFLHLRAAEILEIHGLSCQQQHAQPPLGHVLGSSHHSESAHCQQQTVGSGWMCERRTGNPLSDALLFTVRTNPACCYSSRCEAGSPGAAFSKNVQWFIVEPSLRTSPIGLLTFQCYNKCYGMKAQMRVSQE